MKPPRDRDNFVSGMLIEMACDESVLHARWPDGDGGHVELSMPISDAESLIELARDTIRNYRREQN